MTLTVPVPAGEMAVTEVALLTTYAGGGSGAEVDAGGAGQVGAGDGDRGAAGLWARGGADRGDGRLRCVVGELSRPWPPRCRSGW